MHPGCDIDPDIYASELFSIIKRAIETQPRSLQKRIGPSEIGNPCDRRLGYKLAGVEPVNVAGVNWKAYIGTAVHAAFAAIFEQLNTSTDRWLIEQPVQVSKNPGEEVWGSCDLFDTHTGCVWDWKFTTKNKIREEYRRNGPGDQYRTQAHQYGQGWINKGYDVRSVGVVFFTRDGEYTDRYVWHEPMNTSHAVSTLARVEAIGNSIKTFGPEFTLPILATAPAYCNFCPYNDKKSTELTKACPGHRKENSTTHASGIDFLLGEDTKENTPQLMNKGEKK